MYKIEGFYDCPITAQIIDCSFDHNTDKSFYWNHPFYAQLRDDYGQCDCPATNKLSPGEVYWLKDHYGIPYNLYVRGFLRETVTGDSVISALTEICQSISLSYYEGSTVHPLVVTLTKVGEWFRLLVVLAAHDSVGNSKLKDFTLTQLLGHNK